MKLIKNKPVVLIILKPCLALISVIFFTLIIWYPFWIIETLNTENWRITLFLEIVYWCILVIVCVSLPAIVFFNVGKKKKKTARKTMLKEKLIAFISFGFFVIISVYNLYNLIQDEINGYEVYLGECEFTYIATGYRSRSNTKRYVVINNDEMINISLKDYIYYKDYDYCKVIYLPNSKRSLEVNTR